MSSEHSSSATSDADNAAFLSAYEEDEDEEEGTQENKVPAVSVNNCTLTPVTKQSFCTN
jgi:hypothetical protein